MNPIAEELNNTIRSSNASVFQMLSRVGKNLFFPKGILSQSAEAKVKAHKLNATIGIATEKGRTMHLPSVMASVSDIPAEAALTYAPSFGIPGLRKQWQQSLFSKNPSLTGKSISLPVVTTGITHALSVFGDVWVDPEDVIILPDMFWGNYSMIFTVRKGAFIETYPLFNNDNGFNIDAFEKTITVQAALRKKLIILLNFPQNPTGYTVTRAEAEQIASVLTRVASGGTHILAVLDDAYFGLFFEDETLKESLFATLCNAHENILAVKLDGATKENFVWGLRAGFITYGCKCTADCRPLLEALEKKTAGCVRGTVSNASHLSQSIVLKSMENRNFSAEKDQKFLILQNRAKRIKSVLADPKYAHAWEPYPFNSGYFMCVKLKTVDAEPLRVHLLEKYGVGLIALGNRNLRVAFSCLEEDDIPVLFDIVLEAVNDLNT